MHAARPSPRASTTTPGRNRPRLTACCPNLTQARLPVRFNRLQSATPESKFKRIARRDGVRHSPAAIASYRRGTPVNEPRPNFSHAMPAAEPQEAGLSPAGLAKLTAIMQREIDAKRLPGVSMLIARR